MVAACKSCAGPVLVVLGTVLTVYYLIMSNKARNENDEEKAFDASMKKIFGFSIIVEGITTISLWNNGESVDSVIPVILFIATVLIGILVFFRRGNKNGC